MKHLDASRSTQLKASLPYALVGAVAAMVAILVAEIFVQAMNPAESRSTESSADDSLSIALLIDISGSMGGEPIEEVRNAAVQFLQNWKHPNTRLAVVPFEDSAYLLRPVLEPGQDPRALIERVQGLRTESGTYMGPALQQAQIAFNQNPSLRNAVMLFTDGEADDPWQTLRRAGTMRRRGIVITAIGTQDADHNFLLRLTGNDPSKVFDTQLGGFALAFDEAAAAIVTSSFGTASTAQGLVVAAVVALFLAAALLIAENVWGMRGIWWRDVWWIPPFGLALGFLGGFIGESLVPGKITTWALVGLSCGAALGLTDVAGSRAEPPKLLQRIPHKVRRGTLFGLAGGIVGGLLFSLLFGDVNLATARRELTALVSRLAGFGLLGFFIGLAIKAGEELRKEAWLLGTVKGPYEGKQYILSKSAVSIGKSGNNDINLHRELDIDETAGRFLQEQGEWFFQPETADDNATAVSVNGVKGQHRTPLRDNTAIRFGNTEFLFRLRGDPGKLALETRWALVSDTDVFAIPPQKEVLIGSVASCDIVILDGSIEFHHCTLHFTNQGIQLHSKTGSEVQINDKSLSAKKSSVLQEGDLITLGSVELALVAERNTRSAPDA